MASPVNSIYNTPDALEKVAGTPIPDDYKQWKSEVLKALIGQYPFIRDDHSLDVKFDDVDAEQKTAWGIIKLDNQAAIVFTIRPNNDTNQTELDPLDVMFNGDKFQYLSEHALRKALDELQPGRPFPKGDPKDEYTNAPSDNEYVGDLTGDVTPLEYTGFPSSYGGPRAMSMASCGVTSRVVRTDRDVNRLFALLNDYNGINEAAQTLGLDDTLENLRTGMSESTSHVEVGHVQQREDGNLVVTFDNGDEKVINHKELKEIAPDEYKDILRNVLDGGEYIIRDFPTLKSVEAPAINTLPAPFEKGGWGEVVKEDGDTVEGVVATQMFDFDNGTIKKQKIVSNDQRFATAQKMIGVNKSEDLDDHPIVQSSLTRNSTGCFLDESFEPTMSPNVRIQTVVSGDGQPTYMRGQRLDMMKPIEFIVVENLVNPCEIPGDRSTDYDLETDEAYYLPAHLKWIDLELERIDVLDKGRSNASPSQTQSNQTRLFKNARRYTLQGTTARGKTIEKKHMPEAEMKATLARYGADDHAIEKAASMNDNSMTFYDLRDQLGDTVDKEAAEKVPVPTEHVDKTIQTLKEAGKATIEGANAVLNQNGPGKDDLENPDTLDSILSIQFVSEETLSELVQSLPLFKEVEDRLAKLLMASRQGEESIHEKGVQKALEGVGKTRRSLQSLAVELESRRKSL